MLGRWSGWGAIPQIFDETRTEFADARETARRLLGTEEAWAAARRSTLNAHYTSAEVIGAVWATLGRLGFSGGRVLEPGCGSGNFIGFAPPGAEMVGVELDPTTAQIARQLYGSTAQIVTGRFEDFAAPDAGFDAAIGNVPFAKLTPHDPRHNRQRLALHNYCIAKSLHLVAPGGTVAVLTSRYTLDARNPTARRVFHELADLVGAVRLPAGAFGASSGTDVVADLLILRRRAPGIAPPAEPGWLRVVPLVAIEEPGPGDEPIWVNEWFDRNPHLVAGHLGVDRGMYRDRELTVTSTGDLGVVLGTALDQVVERGVSLGLMHAPVIEHGPARSSIDQNITAIGSLHGIGSLHEGSFVERDGAFGRVHGGQVVPYTPRYERDVAELRGLIGLRDAARAVLAVQVQGGTDTELADAQATLTNRYDTYQRAYGPLNRFRVAAQRSERSRQRRGTDSTRPSSHGWLS